MNILFENLTIKCIFNDYENLHYPNSVTKGVMKVLMKVNVGSDSIIWCNLTILT